MKLSHMVTVLAVASISTACNFGASKKSNPAPEVVPENKSEQGTGTEEKVDANAGTSTSGEASVTPTTTTDAEVAPAPAPAPGGEVIAQPDPALPANPETSPVSPAPAFSPSAMAAAILGDWQVSKVYCHDNGQDSAALTGIYKSYRFTSTSYAERKQGIANQVTENLNVVLSNASSSETHSSADMLITQSPKRVDQSVRLRLSKDAQAVLILSVIDSAIGNDCPANVVAYKMLRK